MWSDDALVGYSQMALIIKWLSLVKDLKYQGCVTFHSITGDIWMIVTINLLDHLSFDTDIFHAISFKETDRHSNNCISGSV